VRSGIDPDPPRFIRATARADGLRCTVSTLYNVFTTEATMFGWAIAFLVVAIIAALFGLTGLAGMAANIAWILFIVGLILFVVFLVLGRRRPPL
jgi:uncharacterized membrane protein YtjA (UPF0391 family)